MSEERPETRSSAHLSVTHDSSLSENAKENQRVSIHMENVYSRIMKAHPHVKVMIVAKSQRFLKTNYTRGVQSASCILNFTDLARVLIAKMFPEEPIEHVRIKGRKDEIFVSFDDLLEIIVVEKEKHKTMHL